MRLSKSVQKEFMTVTSLSKFIALVLFIILPFIGFFFGMQYQHLMNQNQELIEVYKWNSYKTEQQPVQAILGKFSGTIACEDCDGIKTELTLYADSKSMAPRTFFLKESYQGKTESPTETVGNWSMLQGTKKDPDSIIYQLNPDESLEPIYYLKVSDISVTLLDENQNEIKSKSNYSLVKE